MIKALLLAFVLSYIVSCNANVWSDCATPLMKAMYYESVTLFPANPVVGEKLSLNVKATIVEHLNNAGTNLEIVKDGVTFFNTTTRDLCTLLYANDLSCPVPVGKLSYTYKVDSVPTIPAGKYQIRITSFLGRRTLGCLRVEVDVQDPAQSSSCTYVSSVRANLPGRIQHENEDKASRLEGDWIQVGPYGNNAGAAASTFEWGTIDIVDGTTDIVGNRPYDDDRLVWGINGTMKSRTTNANGAQLQHYTGDLYVGYKDVSNVISPIFTGNFDWIFTVTTTDEALTGKFYIRPRWSHPKNYTYPLLLGNLSPLQMERNNAQMQVTGSTKWCTCGVDNCGVCGGDGSTCPALLAADPDDGLSMYAQGATAVGIAGGIVGIAAIIFFAYQIRKMRNEPAIDDMALADPEKPDYGLMAINQVLQEGDRP